MPFVLLSKPVGASGNCVVTETRARVRAAVTIKSFMGSASSKRLGAALGVNTILPRSRQRLKEGACLNQQGPLCRHEEQNWSYRLLRSALSVVSQNLLTPD